MKPTAETRAYATKWRNANRDRVQAYQERYRASEGYKTAKEVKKKRRLERYYDKVYRISMLIKSAKARSIGSNRDIDLEYLETFKENIPDVCPCCNEAFQWGPSSARGKGPSLDRFDNNKGYVKDNVKLICASCNSKKSSMDIDDLFMLLKYLGGP